MGSIWITGASSGIGMHLSLEFARRGHEVAMLARRGEVLQGVLAQLQGIPASAGLRHRIIEADVCDHERFLALARADMDSHGVPDVVIANAGISAGTSVEYAEDYPQFEAILRTNVTAMYSTFAAFTPAMKARGSGTLVGISSVAGVRGLPGSGAYSASKAAATSFCESVRVELRGTGVKVVTIAPGFIKTPMTDANPYPMPFLMPVGEFARKAADAIGRHRSYVVIPWQMGLVARLMRALPNALYDRLSASRGRKPRLGKQS